jgi:hypothetical protein
MTSNFAKCLLSVLLLALAGGCQYTYKPAVRESFDSDAVPKFSSSREISLQNAQMSNDTYVSGQLAMNLRECTDVVLATAKRELSNRGLRVVDNNSRVLKLRVVSVKMASGGGFSGIQIAAELEAQAGNGYSVTYKGLTQSYMAGQVNHMADYALSNSVVEMLKDPKIVEYLTK